MSQFIEMYKDLLVNGKIEDLVDRKIASVKKSYHDSDEIEYIDISSIDNISNTIVETTKYEVSNAPSRAQQCVKKGDILVSTVRPVNRNIAVVTRGLQNLVASTGFCVLRPKEEYREYLLSIVKSDAYTEHMCDKASGGLYPAVNNGDVFSYGIHIPNKELAQKVSTIHHQADKSEFVGFKSQFIEMFGNQNTNDKQWTESLVKDEFKLSMGKTPARSNPECWENGMHRWISISDMATFTRYTGDTSEYITDYAITDSGIKAVPKGTIIMSFKLSIGRTAITSEDIYTNEAIMAFADFDEKKFNIDFLHFLIANKNWLLGAKQAVKGQTLNKESIGNAKIIIPPIEMQEQFASIYNQADKSEYYN
ncbi:MAG: restriction endonuclease subunit S [Bacteroidales bacterium]|nr:restriction endonuclease subunit S [Bacteroidales bacterium]